MEPITLVIFDYSGTLSLGAVAFGRPASLKRHLEKSGMAGIGIGTADRYWHDVVKPTWPSASTSDAGFRSTVADCIRKLKIPSASPRLIEPAVARFLDAYMRHSYIDERWRPLLADIQAFPGTLGLVATDHYAEATAAIRSHLATLDISSIPATGTESHAAGTGFIVANSADLGYLKAEPRFWLTLKKTCLSMPLKKVIMVDDFGLSEQDRSGYAHTRQIEARIDATRQALGVTFGGRPQVIHFQTGQDTDRAIMQTIENVKKALQP